MMMMFVMNSNPNATLINGIKIILQSILKNLMLQILIFSEFTRVSSSKSKKSNRGIEFLLLLLFNGKCDHKV